jgi:hypothetical protein
MKRVILILAVLLALLPVSAQVVSTKTTLAFSTAAALDSTGKVGALVMGEGLLNSGFASSYSDYANKYRPRDLTIEVGRSSLNLFTIADCVPAKVVVVGRGEGYVIKSIQLQFDALAAPSVHAELNKIFGRPAADGLLYTWKTKNYRLSYSRPQTAEGSGFVLVEFL